MKINKKKLTTLLVSSLSAVAIACGGGENGTKDENCDCPDTAHLGIGENCDCDKANCACTLKIYGELFEGGPKIYRSGDISAEDMATAVLNARNGYENLSGYEKINFEGKTDAIYILADDNAITFYRNISGKLVFGIGFNRSATTMNQMLQRVGGGQLPLEVVQAKIKPMSITEYVKSLDEKKKNLHRNIVKYGRENVKV